MIKHWLATPPHQRYGVSPGLTLGLLISALTLTGCVERTTTVSQRDSGAVSKALSSGALLDGAIDTLNRMDEYINLELRPPKVILDATTSKNHSTTMARVVDNPNNPTGRFNYLQVVTRNSWFRTLEVRPGDQVRLFALVDEFGKQSHIKLNVSEVVNDNALLIEGGLNESVPRPTRFEIWRFSNEKVEEMSHRVRQFISRSPSLPGWEPTVDETGLLQVLDRLNQWLRDRKPDDTWQSDPLVSSLPKDLQQFASKEKLADDAFASHDAQLLQEAVWLRDISRWVGGGELDQLKLTARLFDWTVRNIQLERPATPGIGHYRPWHILLYGRGTAEQRAWVFLLLARQQGLDATMLAYQDADSGAFKLWLPAVLIDGKLTLWDPGLGFPIPGPEGKGIATLEEVQADDNLLRHLDLDKEHPYPVRSDDLKQVIALLEASPFSLSRRASLVEARMAGEQKIILSCRPTEVAKKFQQTGVISKSQLWELPYRALQTQHSMGDFQRKEAVRQFAPFLGQPRYWKARVMHFQGKFDGNKAAKFYYRAVRPSDTRLKSAKIHPVEKAMILTTKMHASYFLGLVTFEDEDYPTAIDFLDRRTLQATPEGPWTQGAEYNLARAYEATGQIDKAVILYQADNSPQSHGNRLRGRWLKQKKAKTDSASTDPPQSTDEKEPQ